jgi:Flp pilus assembly protein TadD
MRILLSLLLPLALSGCMTAIDYPYSAVEEQRLMQEIMGPAVATNGTFVTDLDSQYKADLDANIDRRWSPRQRLAVLREYLFGAQGRQIQYSRSATRTAMETVHNGAGNCLSMTNLFVSSARHLGLSAQFQAVPIKPSWDQQGDVLIRYEHIVATGRLPSGERYVVDFLPEFNLGDFFWSPNSDAEALSLYYNNLGAEQLVLSDTDAAVAYFQQALHLAVKDADAWNNMAAALGRQNRDQLAEFSYLRALRLNPRNFSALNNLAGFYDARGDDVKAAAIGERAKRYRRKNPYYHYATARLFYQRQRFEETLLLLNEAVRLKDDEPDFYWALAETYERMGDKPAAEEMRLQAAEHQNELGPSSATGNTPGFWID